MKGEKKVDSQWFRSRLKVRTKRRSFWRPFGLKTMAFRITPVENTRWGSANRVRRVLVHFSDIPLGLYPAGLPRQQSEPNTPGPPFCLSVSVAATVSPRLSFEVISNLNLPFQLCILLSCLLNLSRPLAAWPRVRAASDGYSHPRHLISAFK